MDAFEEMMQLIQRHNLGDHHQRIRQLVTSIEAGILSKEVAALKLPEVRQCVEHDKDFPNKLHRPPTDEQWNPQGPPPVSIGTLTEAPVRFGLDPTDDIRHTLISGASGFGKTVTLRCHILRLAEWAAAENRKLSFLVFDFKGGDFADLPGLLGGDWLLFDAHRDLRLGLHGPGSMPVHLWNWHVAVSFAARFDLAFAKTTFVRVLDWAVSALNRKPGDVLLYPDFHLLLDILSSAPPTSFSSKSQYSQSLMQALESVIRASGTLFESFRGLNVLREVIAQGKSCVFQMSNFDSLLRDFVIDLILGQVYHDRICRGVKADNVDTLFLIDECGSVISQEAANRFPDKSPPITSIAGQGREMALQLVLGTSTIAGSSSVLLANMHNNIVLNQTFSACIRTAAQTLLLHADSEGILSCLAPGNCVVRFSGGVWPHAVLGKVDYVPPRRRPIPPDAYHSHPYVPSKRLSELPHVKEALRKYVGEHKTAKARQAKAYGGDLDDRARKLLKLLAERPYTPVARAYEILGRPSQEVQKSIREELAKREYAHFHEIRLGKRNQLLMETTETGCEFLGLPPAILTGRGGLAHRHFAHWLRMAGERRGHSVKLEWVVPGTQHSTDVLWVVDGQNHIFEVALSLIDNLASHMIACFVESNGVATATIVTPVIKDHAKIRNLLSKAEPLSQHLDRIKLQPIDETLKELWP